MPGRTLFLVLVLSVGPAVAAAEPPAPPSPEENILKKAGVAVDADGLLSFVRQRTLDDAESKQIADLIHRLGGDDFDDRERAAQELRKRGGRATPLLRPAARAADQEIARQATQILKETDPPAPLPAVAAARLLARRAPAGAVAVLLDYLPFADDGAVEDEVRAALLALTPDGRADPALITALDDPRPAKRAAAASVLGRKGDKDQREAMRQRLADADAAVRWQAAVGLLEGHDRTAVPALVDLLADGPFDTAWRAEELLRRLAGDKPPVVARTDSQKSRHKGGGHGVANSPHDDPALTDAPESRRIAHDAWAAWWTDKGEDVDLAHYEEAERLLGYTLGVEYNTGRVWECDIDGSIRWEIRDLAGPMDAQVLPNSRVLIAEADAHRVTERDLKGKVLWEQKVDGEPSGCQRLANGNTFVSTCDNTFASSSSRAMEFTTDGTAAYSIKLENGSIGTNAVRKGRNSHIYYTGSPDISEMDTAGKYLHYIRLPPGKVMFVGLEDLPGGRFLVADSRRGCVLEVNMHGRAAEVLGEKEAKHVEEAAKLGVNTFIAGKIVWQADVPGACGVTRLPNGHMLVGANHKVVELAVDGKPVWEKDAEGYVRRVYRR